MKHKMAEEADSPSLLILCFFFLNSIVAINRNCQSLEAV